MPSRGSARSTMRSARRRKSSATTGSSLRASYRARRLVGRELLPRTRRPGRAGQSMDDPGRGIRFEAWDPGQDGGPLTRLVGEPAWFDPGPPQPGAPVTAPAPLHCHQSSFRPWPVVGRHLGRRREPGGGRRAAPSPLELDRLLDTMLDVIDPESGRLVARSRRDGALRGTGDDALLFGVRRRRRPRPRRHLRARALRPRLSLLGRAGEVSTASSHMVEPIFAAEGFAKRFGNAEVLKAASVGRGPGG